MKYYIQSVTRATYSNGAVRHTYYPVHICYIDYFEYDEPDADLVRDERIEQLQQQIVQELMRQYPPVILFENGTWLHEPPNETPVVDRFLEYFPEEGEQPSGEEPVRIERFQVRRN